MTKTRVLFVDDDVLLLRSIERTFARQPISDLADHYETGAITALARLETEPFDIIVTDDRMPGMTGLELLRRASAIRPQLIRVLMTGSAPHEIAVRAMNDRAIDKYIEKPWPLGALEKVLVELSARVQQGRP